MNQADKPKYTKFKIQCDCILGGLSKVAVFNGNRSSVRTKESHIRVTYYCLNCSAIWVAEWYMRNGAWNSKPNIKKIKDRKHP